jgi:hypothetical protein
MATQITQSVLATANNAMFVGGGTTYSVCVDANTTRYVFYIDSNSDVAYIKSTDSGDSWADPVTVFTGTTVQLAIWFDEWSGLSSGLIHIAYTENVTDDVLYRNLAIADDSLSTQTTIFAGDSSTGNGALSITRSRGGNLYCLYDIDAGTEHGFARALNATVGAGGATWAARTSTTEAGAGDQWALAPGFAADNNDIICIFGDATASEWSRKLYDDSGDSWGETSIAGTMTINTQATNFRHWDIAVDLTNSQVLFVAWSAIDTLNADLRCWTITESAITEVTTNVVLNSTDDQGYAAIGIDTDTEDWYVFYCGASGGGETFQSSLNVYCKISTDAGSTWGAETKLSHAVQNISSLWTSMRFPSSKLGVTCWGAGGGLHHFFDHVTPAAGGGTGLVMA